MRFRLFGFPITLDWSFLAFMMFFGVGQERDEVGLLIWLAVTFVSVLAHELAHAFAFRAFGYRSSIRFSFIGAVTWSDTVEPVPPRRDVVISAAGPVFGVAIGAAILAVHSYESPALGQAALDRALSDLVWVNLSWGLFNLVPVFPLDGGRVMAGVLQLVTGGRAERSSLAVSAGVATAFGLGALTLGEPFIAVFFGALVWFNLRALRRSSPAPRREDPEEAFAARPGPSTGMVLTRALVEAGRIDDAVALVTGPKAAVLGNDSGVFVAGALFQEGRLAEAAEVGARTFEHHPRPRLAYNVACTWARQGRAEETLTWLRRAVDAGYADSEVLESHSDLALVRGTPEFDELRQRLVDRQRQASRPVGAPFTPAVVFIAVLLALVYIAQRLWPHLGNRFANFSPAAEGGQWYRVFTSTLLHVDVRHLVGNVLVFVAVGRLAERHLGTARFVAVYVASGVTGAMTAHLFRPGVWLAMGASGAIAGVMGASAVALFERWRHSGQPFRAIGPKVLLAVALAAFLALGARTTPEAENVDDLAHVGGLACGLILALVVSRRLPRTGRATAAQLGVAAAVAVGTILVVDMTGEPELPHRLVAVGYVSHDGVVTARPDEPGDASLLLRVPPTPALSFRYRFVDAEGVRNTVEGSDLVADGLWLEPDGSVTAEVEAPCALASRTTGVRDGLRCKVAVRQSGPNEDAVAVVIRDRSGTVVHQLGTRDQLRTLDYGSVSIELRPRS